MRYWCGIICFVYIIFLCWVNICLIFIVKASCQQVKLIIIGKYFRYYIDYFLYGFSLEFNLVFKLKIGESYCVFLQFIFQFYLKLYFYFGILRFLLKLLSKIYFKVIKLILLFYNFLILGVIWKVIIKRFDFILRYVSLKLLRYIVMFVYLVNKFVLVFFLFLV